MFVPLALTQALPYLPLAQGDIDYQVERRADPQLIEQVLQMPSTRVLLCRKGKVAVPFGQHNMAQLASSRMRLATLPGSYVARALDHGDNGVVAMYLGRYKGAHDEHVIALDLTAVEEGEELRRVEERAAAAGHAVDAAFGDDVDARESANRNAVNMFEQAVERFDWVDLRMFAPHASSREIGQAVTMLSLANWHDMQRHCPHCGAPTEPAMSGWAQRCTSESDDHRILFPRVEPAVICTVVDAKDRLLLQHNRAWKHSNLFSVSAGFVETGENLEHACRRETLEETGIRVGEVKYLGSQPWPFPFSLMMGFKAQALSNDIHVDGDETIAARWVTRDEYTDLLVTGEVEAPGKATIARVMIEEWYGRELD